MTRILIFRLLAGIFLILTCTNPLLADLTWDDHFIDEDAILSGTTVSGGGTSIRFSTTVFSDSDGGTFDLLPGRSANFFSFEGGTTGNHVGFLEMSFDNQNDDPADYLELSLDFQDPVTNLQFSLLDIDGSPSFFWDDGVEVFYNGVNIRTNPALFTAGSAVFLDNESYMDGFEAGNTSAGSNQTIGNLDLDFGNLLVNNVTVRYFSTDDAVADPGVQFIGISDLTFTSNAVPEPAMFPVVLILLLPLALGRWRSAA